MVLRRERSGGGRVLAGGRTALAVAGDVSRLTADFESSIEGSAVMLACSSPLTPSWSVFPCPSWTLGLSINGSSFNGGSRLTDTCSSFKVGGKDPGIGIDGVGKSL